jgi:RNA polymerase sigma-70 factor (ECF subfamily)
VRVHDGDAQVSAVLRLAQPGAEPAFRVLYRDVQPRLLRYLRVLVAGDAEDVASETWLQIARDLATFRGEIDDFRGWAATIARHRALDHLRRQRRRPAVGVPVEHLAELPADHDTAEAALEALDTDTALALIAALPPDQAEAIYLRVVLGLDARSAGQLLGKSAGAVRVAVHRGLNRLAERLEDTDDHGERPVTKRQPPTLRETR